MREYGFSLNNILPYKNKIYDFVLIRENTVQWKPVFSHVQCIGSFSAQHFLVSILEKSKPATNNGRSFGALFTDLLKVSAFLLHEFMIAKVKYIRVNMSTLQFVHSYLKNRLERTKINSEYSYWEKLCLEFHKDLYLCLYCLIYSI